MQSKRSLNSTDLRCFYIRRVIDTENLFYEVEILKYVHIFSAYFIYLHYNFFDMDYRLST